MTKPELSAFETRALALLAAQGGLIRPGAFGTLLWPGSRRTPSAFARPAGKVLNSLRKQGLAEWVVLRDWWGWQATPLGKSRSVEEKG